MIKKLLFLKAIFICIMVGMMTAAPKVMADTVTLYHVDGYYSGGGGEFTVKIKNNNLSPDLNSFWGVYSSNTRDIGNHDPSFQSFCLEKNEYVDMGSTYKFSISDRAIAGGIDRGNNIPGSDPISVGTAWLYHEFQEGELKGYDYNTNHGHRSKSAGYLQNMIWYLEDEQNSYGEHNPFKDLLIDKFGSLDNAKLDNDGQYPVMVLNLYDRCDHLHQDMLVCDPTPVPEPATMLLLGSGLIGLAGLARRRFRKQ